jgi:hypothetical protein
MPLPDIEVTSEMLWLSAFIALLSAFIYVRFLAKRVQPVHFQSLHWSVVIASLLFWFAYGGFLFLMTWESFYAKFLLDPANRSLYRSILELLPYPLIGLLLWWVASRSPWNPVITFCLLGGLESLPEHLWGIYRLGMLEKVPFLHKASEVSVLSFAVPEYILYWATVLGIARLIQRGWQRLEIDFSQSRRNKAG